MGDEEQGKGGAGGPDTRMEWMRSRVISALRMKDEKFDKLMATEEGSVITNFLDSNDTTRILIFDNGKGELSAVRDTFLGQTAPSRPSPYPVLTSYIAWFVLSARAVALGSASVESARVKTNPSPPPPHPAVRVAASEVQEEVCLLRQAPAAGPAGDGDGPAGEPLRRGFFQTGSRMRPLVPPKY